MTYKCMLFKIHSHITQGRKEMFYLTTHSAHFIYGYMASVHTLLKWLRLNLTDDKASGIIS